MRHPPVLLRPAAAQTAVPDPAPIAVSSVSAAAAVQTGPTTVNNGNSLQHLYSNTGAANHLHTSLPCSSTLHSYSLSAGGGGSSFSANGSHSTSNNATISENHNVITTHGGPQSSLNSSTTTPTPATTSGGGGGPASAFSGSAHSLIGPLLPSARRYVAVRLLTGETLQFDVEVKSKGKELYSAVARHMSSLGMKSTDIFGLAIQIDGEYLFVDPENKLGKYAPKGWKSSHASGLNNAGHPLLVLYFRVKFYVDSHLLIRDRVTRQHYYYQLRENVLRHGQPATEESFFRLAALALQAELGDYDPERHRAAYFDTQLYFPQWILERVGVDYVVQNMPAMHRDHRCLSTGSAQLLYIKEASSGHTHYGLHLYRLRSSKKSDDHNQQQLQLQQQQQQQQQQQHHAHSGSSSSSSHNNAHRLRSAERAGCDSRLSDRGASVTLDRPTKTQHKLDGKIESVLGGLPSSSSSTDDSNSNSRTPLDRTASQRPCSANENPTIQQQLHDQPHTGTVWLGICGRGIDIYEEEDSFTKTVRATFQWPNIGKLCFERKKFEIRAVGCPESRKFTYYTSSDDKSKHLLYLCRVTHQFSMAMQPKLAELRKLEEEANRHYQESMGEGTAVEMGGWCDPGSSLERPDRLSLRGYGSLSKGRGGGSQAHGDQRISVISSTSSNTTSGIVSDKVQSVDESEDELDLDERTRPSPAAAPSLESLALAHLRDSCDSLPAELERRNEAESAAMQQQLRPAAQTSGNNSQQSSSSSTTLPRRLAGLGARLARVGRSSNKAATSTAQTSSASATLPTSSEMSRTGSLHSSSSQHSASTIHSSSRSKSRISPSTTNGWPGCDLNPSSDRVTPTTSNNSSASWLRLNSVDVTDGIASMRLQSAAEENQRRSEMVGCQSSNGNGATGPGDHNNQPHNSGMEEENQYWYSCDDDISETGSTNGEKCPAGVLCTDCRMGIVCCSGSQSQQHHRHHHHRGHEDLPDHHHHHHHHHNHHVNHHHHHLHHAKDPSESSSLCVSVDHTTQDSTLSDCQSYFHSHVSSVDSSLGGSAPPHPLIPAPEMANTPLAATVSALSNGGSLRSLRSAKVSVASDDCGSAVDYSVQSGPAADSSSSASTSSAAVAAAAAMCASPKLDFTVTSAVPNTGTYPRRSTVSNTLDSDSDYVTLPPLCPRMQDNNVVMVPNSYVFMEPMQPKNGGQVTVACVNQLSLRHGVNCKMVDDVASTTYSASSCSSSQMMGLTRPMSAAASAAAAAAAAAASEAAARFITTRPTISILQAHTASTAPATQPSFATPAQHLIPPPPYDIRQHPLYNQQQQQQQQQQQSYHPAQIQAQFQSMDGSSSSAGLTCCQYVPPPAGYSSCQQTDAFEPPPPPPPYPIHLQVQAPLTTANLGLHLSQQSVSSLVSKHSLNSMASSARSLEAVSDSHRIVPSNSHAVYTEDSLIDTKTNGSSSLYGVITTDPEVAASVAGSSGVQVAPVIGKNNYLDIHATNTLSRRPQHPIPSGAQQQSASAQIVQQVNGTVTGGASVPYEQYHLGIPPPPQYPGNGGGSNGVNSSSKASFATVYTNQVTQSQIEQFKAQLYSDVDYVIYPHKDPSLSQQEYLDVKEAASFISSAASSTYSDQGQMMLMGDGAYLPPPPPYRAPSTKSGASSVYRSSPMPNVHLPPVSSTGGIVLSGTTPASHPPLQHLGYGYSSHHQGAGARPASVHYASNQSLSSGNYSSSYSTSNYSSNYSAQVPMAYVPYPSKYLSCQSLASSHSSNPSAAYSASGCYSASSSHSMTGSYEPIGAAIQHAGAALRCKPMAPLPALSRVHSEESILTYDLPQVTTLSSAIARHQEARGLLPPPPPYRKQSLDTPSAPGSTCSSGAPSIATDSTCPSEGGKLPGQKTPLDIKTLREKSRNLDLPLISALCNDTTLLNQAKRKPPMGQQQQQQLQQQQHQLQQQQLQQQQLQQQSQQMQQQQQQQQQQQSVSNIQSMPLPPTPIEAAQGKTTGQPPPKPGGQVNGQSHAYVMPRHPASVSMSQAESSPCRRPALTTPRRNPVAAVQQASQSRPTSWHVDGNNWNVGQGDPAVNGEKSNAPPPPLPPPNSNSAIEAKLQQLQKAAVAIATGPGSIIAEDGKIAKALNLPAFKSVKNSYVVSPSRKHPVSGLYAVTELGKPPSGSRKITPTAFSHPHNNAGSKVSQQHTVPNSSSLSNGKTSFGVVP